MTLINNSNNRLDIKNEHTLYMPDVQQIVDEAQSCRVYYWIKCGFIAM